jgi:hypothetical protein
MWSKSLCVKQGLMEKVVLGNGNPLYRLHSDKNKQW